MPDAPISIDSERRRIYVCTMYSVRYGASAAWRSKESDGSIRIVTAHLISRIPHIPDKTREMD